MIVGDGSSMQKQRVDVFVEINPRIFPLQASKHSERFESGTLEWKVVSKKEWVRLVSENASTYERVENINSYTIHSINH